ncbi:hypothetical protein DFH27DRAFT_366111 [Peziza echinospora]|nr:hypothetical protein DFH27DRAFT_366111 [Peziza echinospora]
MVVLFCFVLSSPCLVLFLMLCSARPFYFPSSFPFFLLVPFLAFLLPKKKRKEGKKRKKKECKAERIKITNHDQDQDQDEKKKRKKKGKRGHDRWMDRWPMHDMWTSGRWSRCPACT